MKYLFVIGILFGIIGTDIAWGRTNCKKHKIYCRIAKLQPKMDKKFAMKLSNIIHKKSKQYGVDPMISLAILNQESSLRNLNTYTVTKKTSKTCDNQGCYKTIIEEHEVMDMTMAQINVNTALAYDFDIKRLFDLDLEYALECHFIVLRDKIVECSHLGKDSWSCYHSATPKYRLKYVSMVRRFM